MMYGGGADLGGTSWDTYIDNVGISDDSDHQFQVEAYLSGSLERYFAQGWGAEGVETENEANSNLKWGRGRVKAVWSGIIGLSADMMPWVGRIPKVASGRREPVQIASTSKGLPASWMAPPGEWISAGFTGEGMVHSWLCGKALAYMVLGKSDEALSPTSPVSSESSILTVATSTTNAASKDAELPHAFFITEKRLKKAKIQKLLAWYH
jgi:glycine/D-amino acid oxidase-like deaminating enzyme